MVNFFIGVNSQRLNLSFLSTLVSSLMKTVWKDILFSNKMKANLRPKLNGTTYLQDSVKSKNMVRVIKNDFLHFNISSLSVTRMTVTQVAPYCFLARQEVLDKFIFKSTFHNFLLLRITSEKVVFFFFFFKLCKLEKIKGNFLSGSDQKSNPSLSQ